MAYADQLYEVVDKYFVQIIMPYGVKSSEAGRYLKKFMPFKRKNFDEYIEAYEKFSEAAKILTMENIEIPEEDEKAQYLKECFYQSQKTFCRLCERNIALYEFQNRKARHEEISVQELKDLFVGVQASMNRQAGTSTRWKRRIRTYGLLLTRNMPKQLRRKKRRQKKQRQKKQRQKRRRRKKKIEGVKNDRNNIVIHSYYSLPAYSSAGSGCDDAGRHARKTAFRDEGGYAEYGAAASGNQTGKP